MWQFRYHISFTLTEKQISHTSVVQIVKKLKQD